MGRNFINLFCMSRYTQYLFIVNIVTKIDDSLKKTYRFYLEWHKIELKKYYKNWRWLKNAKQCTKDIINGYVYVEK